MDQEISDSQRAAFESHLDHCDECRLKIQRWQNLEQEVVAAFRLFGSSNSLLDLAKDEWFEPAQAVVPVSLFDKDSQRLAGVVQPDSRASFRNYPIWVAVTLVLVSAAVTWIVWGKPASSHTQAGSNQVQIFPAVATHQESYPAPHLPTKPVVWVKVQEPVIASVPVTTSRFTVVNVYPVFSIDPAGHVN